MGLLDEIFRDVAASLTEILTDESAVISYVKSVYDSVNDETTTIRREESIKVTPPTPVNYGHLSTDSTILSTDQVIYAPAKTLEALTPPFNPRPESNVVVYIRLDGRDHKVIRVRDWKSGDSAALLEFVVRS